MPRRKVTTIARDLEFCLTQEGVYLITRLPIQERFIQLTHYLIHFRVPMLAPVRPKAVHLDLL